MLAEIMEETAGGLGDGGGGGGEGMGFRVWGLGFEVWGLGFVVCGLGFGGVVYRPPKWSPNPKCPVITAPNGQFSK